MSKDCTNSGYSLRRGHRAYNHCGSMHAEDFLKALEAGAMLIGTDKNYKVYVRNADDQSKFYFNHLDEAGQWRFIEMFNEKRMNIEPTFGLYVTPYFAR